MKRWIWLVIVLAALGAGWYGATRRGAPPEAPFAKVRRERLESVLTTNGRVEPVEWAAAHAERAGRVVEVKVKRGQRVGAGAVLAVLGADGSEAERSAAEARLAQARTELGSLERGGRGSELAAIDAALKKLELELEAARREAGVLGRLVEKQAAARASAEEARDKVKQLEAQVAGERARRAAMVGPGEVEAARARVRDAESAVAAAGRGLARGAVRAPKGGVVYDLAVKAGDWVEAGALVAKVGETERLKVMVYVDEPDLGRVRAGQAVTITWDALAGAAWQGEVEEVATQVVGLGTRQVGEVATVAANPKGDLMPGANINVRILTQVVESALSIPKAALRREGGELGVFVAEAGRVAWRKVETGATSEARAEVRGGLKEGELVALPSDRALKVGLEVTPVTP